VFPHLLQFISTFVGGQSLWAVLAIFCGLVLVGTTFISHTVGAMVILPIVQSVGDKMPGDHSKLLVMGAALMCSGALQQSHLRSHSSAIR
jgi:di/tricarboxylate transporter